jgi:hypothetical protein
MLMEMPFGVAPLVAAPVPDLTARTVLSLSALFPVGGVPVSDGSLRPTAITPDPELVSLSAEHAHFPIASLTAGHAHFAILLTDCMHVSPPTRSQPARSGATTPTLLRASRLTPAQ